MMPIAGGEKQLYSLTSTLALSSMIWQVAKEQSGVGVHAGDESRGIMSQAVIRGEWV